MNDTALSATLGYAYARWLREPADDDPGLLIAVAALTYERGRIVLGTLYGIEHGY
jgi:hypothetical protein